MQREHIQVYYATRGKGRALSRVPFDMIANGSSRECWVRYRGGRLFLRSVDGQLWKAFRFEPKRGNAYSL